MHATANALNPSKSKSSSVMVRQLPQLANSDDDLPELSTLLRGTAAIASPKKGGTGLGGKNGRGSSQAERSGALKERAPTSQGNSSRRSKSPVKRSQNDVPAATTTVQASYSNDATSTGRIQRPLKLAHVNSLLLPLSGVARNHDGEKGNGSALQEGKEDGEGAPVRSSPRKRAENKVDYGRFGYWSDLEEEDEDFIDLDGFIVDDDEELSIYEDDSDVDEVVHRGKTSRSLSSDKSRCLPKEPSAPAAGLNELNTKPRDLSLQPKGKCGVEPPTKLDPREKTAHSAAENRPQHSSRLDHDDTFNDRDAVLKFSPPQSKSPIKIAPSNQRSGFVTPPTSPMKLKLQSPSKYRTHIPPSPHRPSIDAFWSAEVINDWNDQYSPKKTPHTNRRKELSRFLVYSSDEGDGDSSLKDEDSPTTSPRERSPTKTGPTKKTQEKKLLAAKKKAFDDCKHALATAFLADVDSKVTDGRISSICASTGGVRVVWSKNLRSTAGRANWRRTTSSKSTHGAIEKIVQHHASIELAEKVIDDEERLFNTLAHEFCHLANFMISNVKDNPHGQSFKEWARKVTSTYANHPQYRYIEVTTKHSYAINHKYLWVCQQEHCAAEYGRHSKSIDPAKHRCGKCRGSLVQVRPKPRGGGKSPVKKEEAEIETKKKKENNPLEGLNEALKQEEKESGAKDMGLDMKLLQEKLEVVELGD